MITLVTLLDLHMPSLAQADQLEVGVRALSPCGPDALLIQTEGGLQELRSTGQKWARQPISKEAGVPVCSTDGTIMLHHAQKATSIYIRSSSGWTKDLDESWANIDGQTVFTAPDQLIALPNHIESRQSDVPISRYRLEAGKVRTEKSRLFVHQLQKAIVELGGPQSTLDIDHYREGEIYSGATIKKILFGSSNRVVILFNFTDADVNWIAWGEVDEEGWTVRELPRAAVPDEASLLNDRDVIVPVVADDRSSTEQNVALHVYKCELTLSFACVISEPTLTQGDLIVAVKFPNFLVQEADCFKVLRIDGEATPCSQLGSTGMNVPLFFNVIDRKPVVALQLSLSNGDRPADVRLYDLPTLSGSAP